jgi:exonuclease VII small subunit
LTQLQPNLDYDLYSIAWKEHFKFAKLNQQMSSTTQDGTTQMVAGGSAFNEEAVRKLENYQPWKSWLTDESIIRYLNNCSFMSDVFYEPIPSERHETSKEQFEEIKQQLQNYVSKLDEEILQLTSERELSNFPFLEYFRGMSKSETAKRKLEEYFASQSKEDTSSSEQPVKKQKQRERKEFKLQ